MLSEEKGNLSVCFYSMAMISTYNKLIHVFKEDHKSKTGQS